MISSSMKSPAYVFVIWSASSGIVPCMRQRSVVPAPMSMTSTSSSMSRPYATENGSEQSITESTDSRAASRIASLLWIEACAGTPITA